MHILDFSAFFSDVHCPIKLSFVFAYNFILPTNSCEDENTCEVKRLKNIIQKRKKILLGLLIEINKITWLMN